MSDKHRELRDEIKKKIKDAASDTSNIASAINVGGKGRRTSVSSRQKVVHRDGVTTTTTEKHEERSADD